MRELLWEYIIRDDWPVKDKFGDQLPKDYSSTRTRKSKDCNKKAKRQRDVLADSDGEYFPRTRRKRHREGSPKSLHSDRRSPSSMDPMPYTSSMDAFSSRRELIDIAPFTSSAHPVIFIALTIL
ncbi:hypothetical protein A0H81_01934 [Grifola frondosa]|uniref:Uncharacterized protein n=1 Tax=Grifola frondosa TaxID=5627 RepID=A0A1C7ML31_GRIFR|nr:hypothetical protein A0H81_01934 [Grifola frondosa]